MLTRDYPNTHDKSTHDVAFWWFDLVQFLSRYEDTNGNDHEHGRNTESQREARVLAEAFDVLTQHWCQESGDERTGVDGEVKDGEELFQLLILFWQRELLTTESRNAGFDPACSEGDESQAHQRECPAQSYRQTIISKKNFHRRTHLHLWNGVGNSRNAQYDAADRVQNRQVENRSRKWI